MSASVILFLPAFHYAVYPQDDLPEMRFLVSL